MNRSRKQIRAAAWSVLVLEHTPARRRRPAVRLAAVKAWRKQRARECAR